MESPYRKKLENLMNQGVIIHRTGAPAVGGKLTAINDDGCEITQTSSSPGSVIHVFIAHKDIRGVAHKSWDFETIG